MFIAVETMEELRGERTLTLSRLETREILNSSTRMPIRNEKSVKMLTRSERVLRTHFSSFQLYSNIESFSDISSSRRNEVNGLCFML